MDDWLYWIALKDVKGVGDVLIGNLIEKFGSPKRVFDASESAIIKTQGLNRTTARMIKSYTGFKKIEGNIKRLKKCRFKIITIKDDEYPVNLRNIYLPPPFIYVSGEIKNEDRLALAIVGSRDCDQYGVNITRKFSEELTNLGITVVSGMARGIDTVAHKESMENGGRTLAVLGNGLDIVYPPENKKLYREVTNNGALISEFPLGSEPNSVNFPKRNRLISGLSLGVLVVQASLKSGALITASYSGEQNREIFAIPGSITNRRSSGVNSLIKSGAKLVDSFEDIIEEIGAFSSLSKEKVERKNLELSNDEREILNLLENGKLHIDQILGELNKSPSVMLSLLLHMEIRGIISRLPGKFFETK